jgi:hypothetical protein
MPYKSMAQEHFMNMEANNGNISPKVVDEFNKASKGMKLPQYANGKPKNPMPKSPWAKVK